MAVLTGKFVVQFLYNVGDGVTHVQQLGGFFDTAALARTAADAAMAKRVGQVKFGNLADVSDQYQILATDSVINRTNRL
jgi:hypothetical protein